MPIRFEAGCKVNGLKSKAKRFSKTGDWDFSSGWLFLLAPDRLSYCREAFPILQILSGLLGAVPGVEFDPLGIFQNVYLDALFPQQIFVPASVGHVAYHYAVECSHVDEGRAHIARAERSENCCPAEVLAPGVAH